MGKLKHFRAFVPSSSSRADSSARKAFLLFSIRILVVFISFLRCVVGGWLCELQVADDYNVLFHQFAYMSIMAFHSYCLQSSARKHLFFLFARSQENRKYETHCGLQRVCKTVSRMHLGICVCKRLWLCGDGHANKRIAFTYLKHLDKCTLFRWKHPLPVPQMKMNKQRIVATVAYLSLKILLINNLTCFPEQKILLYTNVPFLLDFLFCWCCCWPAV